MRPTRTLSAAVAAIAIALLAPAAATATPAPGATTTATGTARTSSGTTTDQQHVDISWSLGPGEYACGVIATSGDAQVSTPVSPTATSTTLDLPATGGTAIRVELRWAVAATQATRPEDACAGPSASTTTVTAATYSPPPPPTPAESTTTAPTAPPSAPTETSSTPAAPTAPAGPTTTADLQAQIDALAAKVAALEARVQALEAYLAEGGFVTDTVSSAYVATAAE